MTNKMNVDEIVVDGETYVKKSARQYEMTDNYVVVRADRAGVFAGEEYSKNDHVIELHNCRKLWYWDGAAAVEQLAVDGVSKPENCKFTVEVPKQTVSGWNQIIPATKKAQKSIREVSVWLK